MRQIYVYFFKKYDFITLFYLIEACESCFYYYRQREESIPNHIRDSG